MLQYALPQAAGSMLVCAKLVPRRRSQRALPRRRRRQPAKRALCLPRLLSCLRRPPLAPSALPAHFGSRVRSSMPLVGFWQVTVVPLSTPDGRSLSDPSRQYPWTGQAVLVSTDALRPIEMPLTGGSLPEPGTKGSVFRLPLFITVSVSGWHGGGVAREGGAPARWGREGRSRAATQHCAIAQAEPALPPGSPSPVPGSSLVPQRRR